MISVCWSISSSCLLIGTWQLRPIYRFSWITFNEIQLNRCLSLYLVNCTKTTYYNTLRKPFHTSLFDYFIHFYEHECFVSLASNLKIRFFWLFEKKNLFTFYLHMHFIACEKRFAMCIVYESSVKNRKNISQKCRSDSISNLTIWSQACPTRGSIPTGPRKFHEIRNLYRRNK